MSESPKKSSKSKQKWNASHYSQVKAWVSPEIHSCFRAACDANGVSIASVLSRFMADYASVHTEAHPTTAITARSKDYGTRKARRAAVKSISELIGGVLTAEESYFDSVPDNLQGSKWHEASEASIAVMQEIIALLDEVYI